MNRAAPLHGSGCSPPGRQRAERKDEAGKDTAALPATRADEVELRDWLLCVARERDGANARIVELDRRDLLRGSSGACEVVSLRLANGGTLELFLKGLGAPRLGPHEARMRGERERYVYRDLLAPVEAGTPRCYGTRWDAGRARLWVILDYVAADPLHWRDRDHFVAAAVWLARTQSRLARHADGPGAWGLLLRHDAGFFTARMNDAVLALARRCPPAAERLASLASRYERLVPRMTDQPPTLVHGAFRKRHVLIRRTDAAARVSPVDWGLAALGSPLFDLAYLVDGCPPPLAERVWEAYRDEAVRCGARPTDRVRAWDLMRGFQLHRVLDALAEGGGPGQGPYAVRLVARAERLLREIERGEVA